MSNEASTGSCFAVIQFTKTWPTKKLVIDWREPERILVSVELANEFPGTVWHREWIPERSSAQEVQKLLASGDLCFSNLPMDDGDNVLRVAQSGKTRDASWLTETEGAGLALLRNSLFSAGRVAYLEALVQLHLGHNIFASGRARESMPAFFAGIDFIGSSYRAHGVLDDSGQALCASYFAEKKGRWEVAANILESVLESRTTQYAEREGLPVECVRRRS